MRPTSFREWKDWDARDRKARGEPSLPCVLHTELKAGEWRRENGEWQLEISLEIVNLGATAEVGRCELRAAAPGTRVRAETLNFHLTPGETVVAKARAEVASGTKLMAVQTVFDDNGLVPVHLLLAVPQLVPRLAPGAGLDWDAPPFQTNGTPDENEGNAAPFSVWLAHTGEHLAVRVEVRDAAPAKGDPLYSGSCVELVASPGGDREPESEWWQPVTLIRQFILVPALGGEDAQLWKMTADGPHRLDDATIESEAIAGGYALRALVPLEAMGVPQGTRQFLLDIAVNAAPTPGAASQRLGLFGAASPFDSSAYGVLIL